MARVLFWSELFWPYIGGAEVFAAGLLPRLHERGHEFLVVTCHGEQELPDEDDFQGIPVCRLPVRTALAAGDLRALTSALAAVVRLERSFAPDLVHAKGV